MFSVLGNVLKIHPLNVMLPSYTYQDNVYRLSVIV